MGSVQTYYNYTTSRCQACRCWAAHSHPALSRWVRGRPHSFKVKDRFVSSYSSPYRVPGTTMSSNRPRRLTLVDRLVKVLKPTKSSLPPSSSPLSRLDVPVAVKDQGAPPPRIFSLPNKSDRIIRHKRSFAFAQTNASSASVGHLQPPGNGTQPWYIPNEATIFPLPAPRHPAFRSQSKTPATSSSHGHERRPSLTSGLSHATSDLHTPIVARRPRLTLWIPEPGTVSPGREQGFPTGCRDGIYFDLPDGDSEDREGPASALGGVTADRSVASNDASDGVSDDASEYSSDEEDVDTKPEKVPPLLPLELRSSFWIQNEVAGIQDEEMRRLATLAFL